jgi:hypothetical protein
VVEPERVIASGIFKRVVMVFGAQTGKSELMLDVAGQRLDQRPGPILYVGPSKQFLTEQFEPRVMALLDEAPTLMAKVDGSTLLLDSLVEGQRLTVLQMPITYTGHLSTRQRDEASTRPSQEFDLKSSALWAGGSRWALSGDIAERTGV